MRTGVSLASKADPSVAPSPQSCKVSMTINKFNWSQAHAIICCLGEQLQQDLRKIIRFSSGLQSTQYLLSAALQKKSAATPVLCTLYVYIICYDIYLFSCVFSYYLYPQLCCEQLEGRSLAWLFNTVLCSENRHWPWTGEQVAWGWPESLLSCVPLGNLLDLSVPHP